LTVRPEFDVFARVDLTIDTTNTNAVNESIEVFENAYTQDWTIISESLFITSRPTNVPTSSPSAIPTTLFPTVPPSITGLVVTITASSAVTLPLTLEEISNISTSIINAFEVSDSELSSSVAYSASGVLDLASIPDGTTEDDIANAVQSSLVDLLQVHPSTITVSSVDLESGRVEYEISVDTYDGAQSIQSDLDDLANNVLEDSIQDSIPSVSLDNHAVGEDVAVTVTVVIDASDVENIGVSNELVSKSLSAEGFDVESNVAIVTAAPSVSPSFTTVLPSPAPSITGIVVTMSITGTSETLNDTLLDSLASDIAKDFGVDDDDVVTELTYAVSGTLSLDGISNIDETSEEFDSILEGIISDILDVHSSAVSITVDSSTGEVSYSVITDSSDAAESVQELVEQLSFVDDVNGELAQLLPDVVISSRTVDEDIIVNAVITVDATDSEEDISDVSERLTNTLESDGFSASTETMYVTPKPTSQPQMEPTTSTPSAQPSMVGLVAIVAISAPVTESFTDTAILNLERDVSESFNVSTNDVLSKGNITKYGIVVHFEFHIPLLAR